MGDVIWLNQEGRNMSEITIFDVAKTFLSMESMTHKKLQKLCYYAQAWHLALFNERLFDDRIEAWIHGPVVPDLYQEYRDYGWQEIPEEETVPADIDKDTCGFLEEVYNTYGEFTGDELEDLTHEEKPWQEAREGLRPLDPSHNAIKDETMREFYLQMYEEGQND